MTTEQAQPTGEQEWRGVAEVDADEAAERMTESHLGGGSKRLLRELLGRWDGTPKVELVPTDGFLLPNAELQRRGILERKGFPESYQNI